MNKQFTVGQHIVCEKTLPMGDGEDAFTAGQEYEVLKVTRARNVCVRSNVQEEHWLGLDEDGDPSWSNYFRVAEQQPEFLCADVPCYAKAIVEGKLP